MAKFKVTGLKELQRDLDKASRDIVKETDKEIKRIADEILKDAVNRVHVRSGFLKASAFIEKINGGYVIGFSAVYAPYEEFGTGPLTEAPAEFEEEARKFFVSGNGYQPAHPFFFPAFLARRDEITNEISKKLDEYLKSF